MIGRLAIAAAVLGLALSAESQSLRVRVANDGTSVSLTWSSVAGAVSYTVRRASTYPTWDVSQNVGSSTAATLTTETGHAYVYTVLALNAQSQIVSTSNAALVTTFALASPPASGTRVLAASGTELRTMLTAAMSATGAGTPSWTNSIALSAPVRAADLSDLRNSLSASLQAIGLTPPAYTDSSVSGLRIKYVHFEELLSRTRAYPEWITLAAVAQTEPWFSPNGDGVKDTTTITASFVANGTTQWQLNVRNAANAVVRSAIGASNSMAFAWNGRNDANAVQPDGVYQFQLVDRMTLADLGALATTVDTTEPNVTVTAPSAASTISNVRLAGSGDALVQGTATDIHFASWELRQTGNTQPEAILATGTTAIAAAATLATWNTLTVPNGVYALKLKAADRAGNSATVSRDVTVAHFASSQNVHQIRAATGETVTYASTLPFPLAMQLKIVDNSGQLVRQLVDTTRAAGSYTDVWDGENDAGQLVPDGVYRYKVLVTENTTTLTWDESAKPVSALTTQHQYPRCIDDAGAIVACDASTLHFDPWAGKPLRLAFCVDSAAASSPPSCAGSLPAFVVAKAAVAISEIDASCNSYCFYQGFRPGGMNEIDWFGTNINGAYLPNVPSLTVLRRFAPVSRNLTLVYGTEPVIRNLVIDSPMFNPAGPVPQEYRFDVEAFGTRQITILAEFTNAESGATLRTIALGSRAEGAQVVTWDGRADGGAFVAPGAYRVAITVTDSGGSRASIGPLTVVRY